MYDILNTRCFSSVENIERGWSTDKKYKVTDTNGISFLLRISSIDRFDNRKALFEMQKQVASLDIPMCLPIEFGICTDGVYILQSWINGEDLESVLPSLPVADQYLLGKKSGEILRKIHSIPAPETQDEWAKHFNCKTDKIIERYNGCGIRFNGDMYIFDYISKNRHLLENRSQCFQHGDYHSGNMMLDKGELVLIDFDRYDFGDPWEEFNRIVFSAELSAHFATGQLRGYFGSEPPKGFFELLTFYISCNTLSSIPWAIPFGHHDVDIMIKQTQIVLSWFKNMQNPIPTWYLG